MTITATVQKLEDGGRNLVVHLTAEVSGGDQEYAVKKIDVATLAVLPNTSRACTHVSIEKIQFSTVNLNVKLQWEGTPNAFAFTCPANFSDTRDLRQTTPIQNNATLKTGNLLLTTENTTDPALDGSYDIVLWCRKKYE